MRIIADPVLFWYTSVVFMVLVSMPCFMIWIAYRGLVANGQEIGMLIFGIILLILVLVVYIMTLPKYLSIIELDNQGITIKTPLKAKNPQLSYKYYKYMQLGCYRQGKQYGLSYWRPFLVLSQKWISNEKLIRINTIENSEQTIKIKLSKNVYKKLLRIFPQPQIDKLKKLVKENLPNYL